MPCGRARARVPLRAVGLSGRDRAGRRSARPGLRSTGLTRSRVRVDLGERGYDVLVGAGRAGERSVHSSRPGPARPTVVTQDGIGVEVDPGVAYEVLTIPDGERAKSLATVEEICRFMARVPACTGATSSWPSAAAWSPTWPATRPRAITGASRSSTSRRRLLGQVDAAIGGKTGVNLPEGKNLVGSFWQPVGVLCDTEALASLPEREWRSGHGEMAKYAFLGVEDLDSLDLCEQVAALRGAARPRSSPATSAKAAAG